MLARQLGRVGGQMELTADAPVLPRFFAYLGTFIWLGGERVTTISDAIAMFLQARTGLVSQKTLRTNKSYLHSLADWLDGKRDLSTVTLQHLRAWRASLFAKDPSPRPKRTRPRVGGKLSVHTIHGMVRTVRTFFSWLAREGILETNVAARLELPPLPKGPPKNIAESDFWKLLDAARASARDTALLWFLRDTGCRLGGATHLKLRDLDVDGGTAVVWEKGRGGHGIARAVFLKPRAVAAVCAWLAVRPATCDLDGVPVTDAVFVSERHPHRALSERGIQALLKRLAKEAGVSGVSNPHSFRHGLAKRMLVNGASLGAVSQILGHSSIKTTNDSYGVFVTDELQAQHARFA